MTTQINEALTQFHETPPSLTYESITNLIYEMVAKKVETTITEPIKVPLIYKSLLKAQTECPTIEKDLINPHLKTKYAGLASVLNTVLPVLQRNNILYTSVNELDHVLVRLIHIEDGSSLDSRVYFVNIPADMQKLGSAITYGRRYGILGLMGICADLDDDGHSASVSTPVSYNAVSPSHPSSSVIFSNNVSYKTAIKEAWDKHSKDLMESNSKVALRVKEVLENNFKDLSDDQIEKMNHWIVTTLEKLSGN